MCYTVNIAKLWSDFMLSLYLAMFDNEESKSEFEQLYTKYAQDMYAIAYSILKNKEDAEDAVHQSFVKIAENFVKVSSLSCQGIRAYIVIISENTAKNIYSRNKKHAERSAVLSDNITLFG